MTSAAIHQLAYFSRAERLEGGPLAARTEAILAASRRNNARDGITGFLVVEPDWFVQVLEGAPDRVAATYARIAADPRHGALTVVSARDLRARAFPDWSMGASVPGADPARAQALHRHGVAELDPPRLLPHQILGIVMSLSDAQRLCWCTA